MLARAAAAVVIAILVAADSAAFKLDPMCVSLDLETQAIIEKHENSDLQGAATLIDTATLIEFARTTCASGDTETAMVIYKSTILRLEAAIRELKKPTELPQAWMEQLFD